MANRPNQISPSSIEPSSLRARRRTATLVVTVSLAIYLAFSSAPVHAQNAKPSLAGFYTAISTEKYAEAKRQADLLLPQSPPEQKFNISLAYGRVLLGLQQKEPARQYLQLMGKQNLPGEGPRLLSVYQAWLTALDGKPDDAIKSLEGMLEQNVHGIATAEAADVLAMLYLAKKDRPNAQRAVDFGLKFIGYAMLKTDYTETLLRNRMGSTINSPEAEKLYVAAEKLRQEQKFVEAGRLYNQICQQHASTEWVHPAQFRIGQCLLGLNRHKQALDHWKSFIGTLATGPWRGQARVAMIDLVLETDGDLKTASEHSLAAATTLGQTLDKEAEASWKAAAFDIHVRHGIIALVDSRYDAALTSLKQARGTAPADARLIAGLDRLIESADKRTPLLPEEVRAGDPKAVLALSFGTVFNMLRQFEVSRRLFYVPLAKGKSGSPTHRSFAAFGLARAIAGLVPPLSVVSSPASKAAGSSPPTFAQAKSLYQQSLKEYANGSWHDETFRDLALLIERMAADKFVNLPRAEAAAAAQDKTAGAKPPARPNDAQRFEQAQQLAAARFEALVSWAAIPKQFPSSRHVPQAYYHAGVLLSEAEKPAEALATFSELVKRYPNSPWTGDAQVWLIDVKLEQQFDLPGAASLATAAIGWYEKVDSAAVAQARQGYAEDEAQGLRTLKQVGYDIYLRAGLVEYLQEKPEQATAFFEKAKPLAPARNYEVIHGKIPSGIERLIATAQTGKSITPEVVLAGDIRTKLILMLADLYHEGQQFHLAVKLCDRVERDAPESTKEQRSWAYFKRARSYFSMETAERDLEAAYRDYAAAVRTWPQADWADDALFLAANIRWNSHQDANGAAALWQRLVSTYPESEEADRAAYFIGVAYHWGNQPEKAKRAFEEFQAAYPASRFFADASKSIQEVNQAIAVSGTKPKRRE